VKGPCYIGKGVIIRHGSYVRNGCIFLEKALVGHGCEIKRSIFLKEARAAHFNYVGDSVLGGGVNLGAGAILSNMRLDKKNIKVKIEGAVIEGPHKLGAIVGDGCQIGCNAVLNPGTFLMKGSCCYPNCTLSGVIEENSVYRS
jgi:NDP-sugar pyrophosphorylase family protein